MSTCCCRTPDLYLTIKSNSCNNSTILQQQYNPSRNTSIILSFPYPFQGFMISSHLEFCEFNKFPEMADRPHNSVCIQFSSRPFVFVVSRPTSCCRMRPLANLPFYPSFVKPRLMHVQIRYICVQHKWFTNFWDVQHHSFAG